MKPEEYIARGMSSVPGWFSREDAWMFTELAAFQRASGLHGDLLEIGVYQGRSAVLLGLYLAGDETLHVCDVFDGETPGAENAAEHERFYRGLSRESFEANYGRFHVRPPVVHCGPSDKVLDDLPAGSFRVIHVDGSHSYDVVRKDIALTRRLAAPGGCVVFDDIGQRHAPGVAAAVWQATADGLIPIAITQKLYATWDPALDVARLQAHLAASGNLREVDAHFVGEAEVAEMRLQGGVHGMLVQLLERMPPAGVDMLVRVREAVRR